MAQLKNVQSKQIYLHPTQPTDLKSPIFSNNLGL